MKKYIYIITFVLLGMNLNAQSVWDGKREAIRKGSGTETDPHLIENAQNFAWLCYLINHDYTEWTEGKYFLLTTDIDLNLPVINTTGYVREWGDELYGEETTLIPTPVRLIPYFAFANRGETNMIIWMLKK